MAIRKINSRSIQDAAIDIQSDSAAPTRQTLRPSLNLDFVNSQTVDPRVTFSRSSVATYVAKTGYIKTASIDEPRIEFDPVTKECKGLLLEETRTNLILNGINFNDSGSYGWNKIRTIAIPNMGYAPDGTYSATKLVADAASGSHDMNLPYYPSHNASQAYTFSVYVKAAGTNRVYINFVNSGYSSVIGADFNLSTGTVGSSTGSTGGVVANSGIINVGNGWYRIYISGTVTANAFNSSNVTISLFDNSGSSIWVGDYNTGAYIWGAQLEAGIYPSSYIYPTIAFTGRSSTATFSDGNAVLRTAAANVYRSYNTAYVNTVFQTTAPVIEAASTNYVLYSEQFDNAVWAKTSCTVSANAAGAPDSTMTADKLVESSATAEHTLLQSSSISCNQRMTFSVYVRAAGRSVVDLIIDDTSFTNRVSASFDLTNMVYNSQSFGTGSGAVANITSVGSGWYRISLTGTPASSGATTRYVIYACNAYDGTNGDGTRNYLGDGTSGIYVWGAQLEVQPYATSYIPTTSASATRAADSYIGIATTRAVDVAQMVGNNFAQWYRPDEWTLLNKTLVAKNSLQTMSTLSEKFVTSVGNTSGSSTNRLRYVTALTTSTVYSDAIGGWNNATQYDMPSYMYTDGTAVTAALSLDSTGVIDYVANGTAIGSATGVAVDKTMTLLNLFTGTGIGYMQKLSYYPKKVSNAELINLTS